MQHLVMDRYSALARWINEINNNKKLKPYFRNDFLGKYTKLLYDLQHLCIWIIFFGIFDYKIIIEIFFVFSLLLQYCFKLHLLNNSFSSSSNQKITVKNNIEQKEIKRWWDAKRQLRWDKIYKGNDYAALKVNNRMNKILFILIRLKKHKMKILELGFGQSRIYLLKKVTIILVWMYQKI